MVFIKKFWLYAFLVLLVGTGNAAAATYQQTCNTCSNTSSAYSRAVQVAEANATYAGFSGSVHVTNYTTKTSWSWSITAKYQLTGPGGEPEFKITSASVIPTPSSITSVRNNVYNSSLFALSRSVVDVPSDTGFDTALDVSLVVGNRGILIDWFKSDHAIQYHISQFLQILNSNEGMFHELPFTLRFSNGSTLTLKLRAWGAGMYYVSASAKDSDGNPYPDRDASGAFTFAVNSTSELTNLQNSLGLYGINVLSVTPMGGQRYIVTVIDLK